MRKTILFASLLLSMLFFGCGPTSTALLSGTYFPDDLANSQGLASASIDSDAMTITFVFSASSEERSLSDVTDSFEYACDDELPMTTLAVSGDPVLADDGEYSNLHVVALCTEGNIRIGWSDDENMALTLQ